MGTIEADDGPYAQFNAAVGAKTADAYKSRIYGMWGGGPDVVAKAIEKAIARRGRASSSPPRRTSSSIRRPS